MNCKPVERKVFVTKDKVTVREHGVLNTEVLAKQLLELSYRLNKDEERGA
jgi:hypothetical protein